MAGNEPFQRFYEVTEYLDKFKPNHRIFRGSSPNYNIYQRDPSQNFDQRAADFLVQKGINSVISFNSLPYSEEGLQLLPDGIKYKHLPVQDFQPITKEQLWEAIHFIESMDNAMVLIHCGYGHGRTGTAITAMQLYSTDGKFPAEELWQSRNHVETGEQVKLLRDWRTDCATLGA